MRSWSMAVLGVGVLAGCGAEPQSAGASGSAGGERLAASEIIEVDESALPRSEVLEVVEVIPVLIPTPVEPGAEMPSEAELQADAEIQSEAELQRDAELASARAQPRESTESPMTASAQSTTSFCPSEVPGLQARARETEAGAVLVLTTTHPERVDELRGRLRRFASLLAEERRDAACAPESESQPASAFADPESLIHGARDIRLVEIPRGVRVEIVPYADQPRRTLMTQLREDARSLGAGRCPLTFQTT